MTSAERPRIPPGQHVTERFPELRIGDIPSFDPKTWDLRVTGAVRNPMRFTWDEFSQLPKVVDVSDFHCVTTWSRLDNRWEGVRFVDLMRLVEPLPKAVSAMFYCGDGYTTSLRIADLENEHVLLATGLDGGPLSLEHGGPMRLVVPHLYAYKCAKWVRQIDLLEKHELGYWENRGYSDSADPWKEERHSSR